MCILNYKNIPQLTLIPTQYEECYKCTVFTSIQSEIH